MYLSIFTIHELSKNALHIGTTHGHQVHFVAIFTPIYLRSQIIFEIVLHPIWAWLLLPPPLRGKKERQIEWDLFLNMSQLMNIF